MKIYFPQWQGSGKGTTIKNGATTILEYLNADTFISVPLSEQLAGKRNTQRYKINNYDVIVDQLKLFKKTLEHSKPETLSIVGGDCGLEIVPVSYLNKKYPNLGVIWFDAHADINRPCDSSSCNFHGMPLRTLLGEGEPQMDSLLSSVLKPSQIHYVGLRDIDKAEQNRIQAGNIYAPKKINIPELIKTLKKKKITHLYLHFDFDCLDPIDYNQTYYQVPNGLKITDSEKSISALKKEFEVVGCSVLESIATNQKELTPIKGIIDLLMS